MAHVDSQSKVLHAKIVFYGPPLSGKTTNLLALHRAADPEQRTRLFSLNTREDRTLFFDLMPLEIGWILDHILRLHIYTVPGQVHYKATRRMLLKGVDACVFVADSKPEAVGGNLASIEDLRDNLASNGADPDEVPLVFQYNKRDVADATPVDDLEQRLNPFGVPFVTAVASTGDGVVDTLRLATEQVLGRARECLGPGASLPEGGEAAEAADLVESVFRKFLARREMVVRRAVPEWVRNYPKAGRPTDDDRPIEVFGDLDAAPDRGVEPPGDDEVQVLAPEQLLEESLRTQTRIAEEFGALERERNALEDAVEEREAEATRAYDRLVEAEERHHDLLSSLGEDLEAPLASLAGMMEGLAQADPDTAQSTVEQAREESQRLRKLVRDILQARKVEVGGVPFERVLKAAGDACSERMRRKGLKLETSIEDNLPDLCGEEARLAFAMKSVLATAIEASAPGGRIRLKASYKEIRVEADGDGDPPRRFVAVQVRDFGEGYPRERWEEIFALSPDGTRSAIASSRAMLQRLGGVMQVKSKAGKGNLITLYFPPADTASPQVALDRYA